MGLLFSEQRASSHDYSSYEGKWNTERRARRPPVTSDIDTRSLDPEDSRVSKVARCLPRQYRLVSEVASFRILFFFYPGYQAQEAHGSAAGTRALAGNYRPLRGGAASKNSVRTSSE